MQTNQANTKAESIRFNLIIPENVNKKIKYLLGRFPNTEWSGTLFYDIEGNYEDIFTATVKCFKLQDIGTAGFTSFQEDPELAGFMVDNDLLTCKRGLIHSHHTMDTFFSGTDIETLNKEAHNYNHFLSLIVNTAQKYSARMSSLKHEEVLFNGSISTYSFDGTRVVEEFKNQRKENKVVQIIVGKVEIETPPSEVFEDLDLAIKSLQAKNVRPVTQVFNHNFHANHDNVNPKQTKLFDKHGATLSQVKNQKNNGKFRKFTKNNEIMLDFQEELMANRYARAIIHNALLDKLTLEKNDIIIKRKINHIISPDYQDTAFVSSTYSLAGMFEALEAEAILTKTDVLEDFDQSIVISESLFLEDLCAELNIQISDIKSIESLRDDLRTRMSKLCNDIQEPVVKGLMKNQLEKIKI